MASLYRLDYLAPDGSTAPVFDPVMGGDYLTTNRAAARDYAIGVGGVVLCTRIYGAGFMRRSFVVGEDGRVRRP